MLKVRERKSMSRRNKEIQDVQKMKATEIISLLV